jgi:hypothetical protein
VVGHKKVRSGGRLLVEDHKHGKRNDLINIVFSSVILACSSLCLGLQDVYADGKGLRHLQLVQACHDICDVSIFQAS